MFNNATNSTLWHPIRVAFHTHKDFILDWLIDAPKNNKFHRSAVMIAVIHYSTKILDPPLIVSELSTNAGFYLIYERRGLKVNGQAFGV